MLRGAVAAAALAGTTVTAAAIAEADELGRLMNGYRRAFAEYDDAVTRLGEAEEAEDDAAEEAADMEVQLTMRREVDAMHRLLSYRPTSMTQAARRSDFLLHDPCMAHWWECTMSPADRRAFIRSMAPLAEVA